MLESCSFSTPMLNSFLLYLPQDPLTGAMAHHLASLGLAALLGGAIGLERQLKRRPAGLRTHMLICFGCAMFTILSVEIGGSAEKDRIAAQIITGIGFIGAGSILHSKNGVTGLTTATTIFLVASIGMACGGGYYWLAVFGTGLVLLCLAAIGWLEQWFNLKPLMMDYSVITDESSDQVLQEVTDVLESSGKEMERMHLTKLNGKKKITFAVDCTRREHKLLLDMLRKSPHLSALESTLDREAE